MKEVFIYIDRQNRICYADDRDSLINRDLSESERPTFRRYVIRHEMWPVFTRYYSLRFHPLTIKNSKTSKS